MLPCPSGGVAFNQMGRYYQNGDWSLFMYGVFTITIGLVLHIHMTSDALHCTSIGLVIT